MVYARRRGHRRARKRYGRSRKGLYKTKRFHKKRYYGRRSRMSKSVGMFPFKKSIMDMCFCQHVYTQTLLDYTPTVLGASMGSPKQSVLVAVNVNGLFDPWIGVGSGSAQNYTDMSILYQSYYVYKAKIEFDIVCCCGGQQGENIWWSCIQDTADYNAMTTTFPTLQQVKEKGFNKAELKYWVVPYLKPTYSDVVTAQGAVLKHKIVMWWSAKKYKTMTDTYGTMGARIGNNPGHCWVCNLSLYTSNSSAADHFDVELKVTQWAKWSERKAFSIPD